MIPKPLLSGETITIVSKLGLISYDGNGGTVIILHEPMECRCGRLAAIVVNRLGQTLCSDCDRKTT